ncbi:MAG: TIGR02587 family membrane protein [Chloroflexia bacterium]
MQQAEEGTWRGELNDLARATSGAFLFGMPLLFTMEMWWIGSFTEAGKLLLILLLTLSVNIMLAHFEGFKRSSAFADSVAQAIEAVAIGAVASAAVLLVLNRITVGDPLDSILGKIIILAMPLSIGASIANSIFRNRGQGNAESGGDKAESSGKGLPATLVDVGTTIGGGLFIGFAIAPTEEIPMLAAEMDMWHELALMAFSLFVTYIIVFESGFSAQKGRGQPTGPFQHPLTETVLAYTVSLVVALGTLMIFSQVSLGDPLPDIVSKTIILGLPTSLGGAAGRLLI